MTLLSSAAKRVEYEDNSEEEKSTTADYVAGAQRTFCIIHLLYAASMLPHTFIVPSVANRYYRGSASVHKIIL